jgi:hypothetical protein
MYNKTNFKTVSLKCNVKSMTGSKRHINSFITWWKIINDQIISKARKRLYFLSQLKRAKVGKKELVLFFIACIRPILEYASPVFHNGLTNYLGQDLERIQKRALRIILPWVSYEDAYTINWPPTTRPSKRRSFRQTV